MTNDKMGNILTLQRQGKLDSGYSLMDNLTYDYSGNKITKVTDAATLAITYPGAFHFVDGANTANEYTYDANGNLTKDLNKNITGITYNVLNLPQLITFSNGNKITYGYDGSGSKLSVAYTAGGTTVKTDYAGNKVYKNGTLSMMHTEEGYITFSGATPTYHYYLKDHQGNNRVVMNQSGAVEQVNHYYPFGGLFGEGLQTVNQPYKYNGKELDRFEGLDMFDYGARHYDATLGRWFTVDPMVEKYYSMSPYVYVANNPVRFIDPNGMNLDEYGVNERGYIEFLRKKDGAHELYKIDNNLQKIDIDRNGKFEKNIDYITLNKEVVRNLKKQKVTHEDTWNGGNVTQERTYTTTSNYIMAKNLYSFLAKNTSVEFTWTQFNKGNSPGTEQLIITSHEDGTVASRDMTDFYMYNNPSWEVYRETHSHPSGNSNPSGWRGDLGHGKHILERSPKARFFIFTKPNNFKEFLIPKKKQ